MKNLKISENEYQKIIEIVRRHEKTYYETYTVKKETSGNCIIIMGKVMSFLLLKKIEKETNITGWGVNPTCKEIDGLEEGVKIYLYKKEKAAF